jgi:DNA (cytosine-5)-methyltransferase 1
MADPRGNLALVYLAIAQRHRPEWLVWENVPGVLSSDGGRDFGAILGGMVELGYGVAYRVLDAQFFGVPQRRRRVFAVGYLGDWRRAAAILFERHGLSGHPAPRRETGQRIADSLTVGANQCSGFPGDFTEASTGGIAHCLNAGGMGRQDYETETLIATSLTASRSSTQCPNEDTTLIAHSLRGEGFDASEDGTGRGTPLVPVVAFAQNSRDELREMPYVGALSAEPGMKQQSYVRQASAVRRLTPTECLRLQGFPDTYFDGVMLRGKPLADGPKYKMLGNSMCVNVMTWIGQRILMVEALGLADQEQAA